MKNLILSISLIFITITLASAQKFSVGGEIGFISSINDDYEISDLKNRRNTYYGGLNFNFKLNNRISFSSGIHYLRQGYRHSTCYIFEDGVKNELTGKLDYLTIPTSINISFLKSRKLITTFGLLSGLNIKAVQDYPDPIGGCNIGYASDLNHVTQDFSLSGIVGIGYKVFENDKIDIAPTIKYYQGLTNTFKDPIQGHSFGVNRRYSSFITSVSLNYKI